MRPLTPTAAGLVALLLVVTGCYFAWTGASPFAERFEIEAVFRDAVRVREGSPVRIAGIDVGEVTRTEAIPGGGARLTLAMDDHGLPVHADAEAKLRPRIFLEGNFFVELEPGSPSAPELDAGDAIPVTRTAAPVLFGDVLTALPKDVRTDLQVLLRELSDGLGGGGAAGFNRSIRYWVDAYRDLALTNDAALGTEPSRDVRRLLRGTQRTAAGLAADEQALRGLVTSFGITAGRLAAEDDALEASIPALRDLFDRGLPALASVNRALPSLRAFAREALPGTRSADELLAAAAPFLDQARRLVSPAELRGLSRVLRRRIPDLVALNGQNVPVLGQARELSACLNEVLVPLIRSEFPNVAESPPSEADEIQRQRVRHQIQRTFPGLAGESRLVDGDGFAFHAMAVPAAGRVQPAPPTDMSQPPPRRPDVPCETQEPPDLAAPVAPVSAFADDGSGARAPAAPAGRRADSAALLRAARHLRTFEELLDGVRRLEARP